MLLSTAADSETEPGANEFAVPCFIQQFTAVGENEGQVFAFEFGRIAPGVVIAALSIAIPYAPTPPAVDPARSQNAVEGDAGPSVKDT